MVNSKMRRIWVRMYNFYEDKIYWFPLPENCTLCKGAEEIVCEGEPPWPAHQETPSRVDNVSDTMQ